MSKSSEYIADQVAKLDSAIQGMHVAHTCLGMVHTKTDPVTGIITRALTKRAIALHNDIKQLKDNMEQG